MLPVSIRCGGPQMSGARLALHSARAAPPANVILPNASISNQNNVTVINAKKSIIMK